MNKVKLEELRAGDVFVERNPFKSDDFKAFKALENPRLKDEHLTMLAVELNTDNKIVFLVNTKYPHYGAKLYKFD